MVTDIFLYSFIDSTIINTDANRAILDAIISNDMRTFVSVGGYISNLSQRGWQVELISMKSSLHVITEVTLELFTESTTLSSVVFEVLQSMIG